MARRVATDKSIFTPDGELVVASYADIPAYYPARKPIHVADTRACVAYDSRLAIPCLVPYWLCHKDSRWCPENFIHYRTFDPSNLPAGFAKLEGAGGVVQGGLGSPIHLHSPNATNGWCTLTLTPQEFANGDELAVVQRGYSDPRPHTSLVYDGLLIQDSRRNKRLWLVMASESTANSYFYPLTSSTYNCDAPDDMATWAIKANDETHTSNASMATCDILDDGRQMLCPDDQWGSGSGGVSTFTWTCYGSAGSAEDADMYLEYFAWYRRAAA